MKPIFARENSTESSIPHMSFTIETFNLPLSPIRQLSLPPELERRKVSVWVKRDDLLFFPEARELRGNKVRKLKYNLLAAAESGKNTLLTFGGAYSNHIAAVAAAGYLFGFHTIGIIRGERTELLNPVLALARERGMILQYLDRTTYRRRNETEFQRELAGTFGDPFLLPEGGTNEQAVTGAAELAGEVEVQLGWKPDHWCLAAGTGGTSAGLVAGLGVTAELTVIAVVNDPAIADTIRTYSGQAPDTGHWSVNFDYTFGGYAKSRPELQAFMHWFGSTYNIPLEPIYSGKAFYAVFDLIKNGYFSPGSRIVVVHTGGVQGE